jgi:branched-chain amino acid aminotransferase
MRESIFYLNGDFVPESEAKVSVVDRGFNGGDGVYDVTRTFKHVPFKLEDHVARLYRSLRYTRIDCGLTADEMARLSREVVERNLDFLGPDDDFVIWQVVTRGVLHSTVTRKAPAKPTVAIYCMPVAFASFARDYIEGAMLVTPATRRTPPECLEAKAKITNKMNHNIAWIEAQLVDRRCSPLMLDIRGNITETHHGNFFFVAGGKLHTPSDKNVLAGITRSTIIAIAVEMGIPVVEGDFTPYDVLTADEAFTTGTSVTIGPVKSLNGVSIGTQIPGPITLSLIKAWNKMVDTDIVSQALAHIEDHDKQHLLGMWAQLRGH